MNRDSKYVNKVMSYLLAMKNSERFWDSDITVFSCNLEINGLTQSMSGHTEYLKSVKRISDSPTTLGSACLQHIVLFVSSLLYLFITIIYVKFFLFLLPSQDATLIALINIYIIYAYLSSRNAKQRVNTFVFLWSIKKMSLSRQTRYDTRWYAMKNPRSSSSLIIQGIERSCNPLWNVSPIRGTAGGAEVATAAAAAAREEGWKSLSSRRNVTKRQLLSHPLSVMPINQPSLQPSSLTDLCLSFSLPSPPLSPSLSGRSYRPGFMRPFRAIYFSRLRYFSGQWIMWYSEYETHLKVQREKLLMRGISRRNPFKMVQNLRVRNTVKRCLLH